MSNYFLCFNQLEKAKKKEAAFIVTFAKREQEVAELKVWLYPFTLVFFTSRIMTTNYSCSS